MPVVNQVGLAADVPVGVPLIGSNNLVTVSNITSSSAAAGFPITNVANPSTNLKWVGGILTGDEFITVNGLLNRTVSYLAIAKHNLGSQAIPVSVEISDPANILMHFDGQDASVTMTDANTIGSVHAWTANGSAQLDEVQSRFGGSSLVLVNGNDIFTRVFLHFDGAAASTTFTDSNAGGSAHTWTAVGNAQIETAQSQFGGASGLFDGVGDRVATPDSTDFTLGSSDFTIDFWLRPNALANQYDVCGQVDAAGMANANSTWRVFITNVTSLLQFQIVSGTTITSVTSAVAVAVNTWVHIAVVRTGNTLRLFMNGVQTGGDVAFSSTANDSTGNLVVGRSGDLVSPGSDFNGWVDEFRLSVGAARWTANFTPPVGPYSNGTNYVSTPDSTDFTLGSSDFTIDFWFRCDVVGGVVARLAGQANSAADPGSCSFNIRRFSTNVIGAAVFNGIIVTDVLGTTQFTNSVNTGWHHLAFVRTGNILKLFLDGIQEGGNVTFNGSINDSSNAMSIGRLGEFPNLGWNGWIDEFRLVVGFARWTSNFTPPTSPSGWTEVGNPVISNTKVLLHFDGVDGSPSIVDSNQSGGDHSWIPVGGAQLDSDQKKFGQTSLMLNPISGNDFFTRILLHCDGADASTTFTEVAVGGAAHTWTTNGNAQVDTAQSKFGGASMLLDGVGDFVDTPDSADFALGSSNFTIDCWFICAATGGTQRCIAGQVDGAATAASESFVLYRETTNVMIFRIRGNAGATTAQITGTTQFTNTLNNGWHHVAVIRTGNTLRMFIDGVQEGGDVTFSIAANDSANRFAVGKFGETGGLEWNGWIDEFRLSVGNARWVSNFTPPTGPYVVPTDYITHPDNDDFSLGHSNFTIDFWFKMAAGNNVDQVIAGQTSAGFTDRAYYIQKAGNGNIISSQFTFDDGTQILMNGSTAFTTELNNGWNHLAITRNGSTFTLWLNGIQEATQTSSKFVNDNPYNFSIGRPGEHANQFFCGWIDEFRITVGQALWTSTFTPPTSAQAVVPSSVTNDTPILFRWAPTTIASVRIRMRPELVAPEIAVVYVGELLVLERSIKIDAEHVPVTYGRRTNIVSGMSESGNFLGRIVLGEYRQSKAEFSWFTPEFYRLKIDTFLAAAQENPFFWAWSPVEYPAEVGYVWLTNDAEPEVDPVTRRISLELDMRGVV